ncbi:NurA domain-containing protein [Vulcanisaeta distributa]|uniref:NurA domain protein n=1 Tax=Vulcanisaeta distributa (strain DSM 14429 / JCM 11212 / NBRC 100878 / IC-017) TaxID=572478 RepID=E1QSR4_VULDI|nr:NurA domain-containing protein [Vulcanisaeta distributa]ADN49581.1 NurA domain protein [Vulcanisaeta distributa DSM 14429]
MPSGVLGIFNKLLTSLTTSSGKLSAITEAPPTEDQNFRTEVINAEPKHVEGLGGAPPRRLIVIDGSSRRLGSLSFRVFIAGVAIYGLRPPIELYPGLGGAPQVRFLAVKAPSEDVLRRIEEDGELGGFVMVKSHDGKYFVGDYNEDDISDEVRMGLETWALDKVHSELGRAGSEYAVVVDGPTYLGLGEKGGLAMRRVSAIGRLEGLGVPVIGVVKRVENSRKLCSDEVLSEFGLLDTINPRHCSDPLVIQSIGSGRVRGSSTQ